MKIESFGGKYRFHLLSQTIPSKLRMLSAGLFLALLFHPEDEGDILIRNTRITKQCCNLDSVAASRA
jgi:hypothetical protein